MSESTADLEARIDALETTFETELEAERERRRDLEARIDALEDELEAERERRRTAEARLDALEDDVDVTTSRVDAIVDHVDDTQQAIAELQGRELQKDGHLRWDNVERHTILERDDGQTYLDVPEHRLERFQKAGGEYVRLPGSDDPLDHGGPTRLAHGDLLPIQQLARMDTDTIEDTVDRLPDRLAIRVWQGREPHRETAATRLWTNGSGSVREYITASGLKTWIMREESVRNDYAKKLVSRTIDSLLELSQHRLGVTKKTRRHNGLRYKERHVVIRRDAAIPGETGPAADTDQAPETADVHG